MRKKRRWREFEAPICKWLKHSEKKLGTDRPIVLECKRVNLGHFEFESLLTKKCANQNSVRLAGRASLLGNPKKGAAVLLGVDCHGAAADAA